MARAATGQIVERKRKAGTTFAIRFRAYGKREFITLGTTADGWTRARAETELLNVLADVRRGFWRPPTVEPATGTGARLDVPRVGVEVHRGPPSTVAATCD